MDTMVNHEALAGNTAAVLQPTVVLDIEDDTSLKTPNQLKSAHRELFPFVKKLMAEFMGTYLLLFIGLAAGAVDKQMDGILTYPGLALLWGLDVMVMMYTVGHLSGAHFNPAVTIAFATCRRFAWKHVLPYIGVHVLASTLASGTVQIIFGRNEEYFLGTLPSGSNVQSLVLEFLITFYMMFAASGVTTDDLAIGELGGIALGATITINSLLAGSISGASMNPARSLGPAIISHYYKGIWIYILGPVVGAIAGAWFYNMCRITTNKPIAAIKPFLTPSLKFAAMLSMIYLSELPVVFVRDGESDTELKCLSDVNSIVDRLLKWETFGT